MLPKIYRPSVWRQIFALYLYTIRIAIKIGVFILHLLVFNAIFTFTFSIHFLLRKSKRWMMHLAFRGSCQIKWQESMSLDLIAGENSWRERANISIPIHLDGSCLAGTCTTQEYMNWIHLHRKHHVNNYLWYEMKCFNRKYCPELWNSCFVMPWGP